MLRQPGRAGRRHAARRQRRVAGRPALRAAGARRCPAWCALRVRGRTGLRQLRQRAQRSLREGPAAGARARARRARRVGDERRAAVRRAWLSCARFRAGILRHERGEMALAVDPGQRASGEFVHHTAL